ncbi:MAG: N-acetylneuraminate lyase, partial [Verrucomicrobia bacterium]|nr:N-acetylneuraminate lyase [Verrucomicrobiota bacterium]
LEKAATRIPTLAGLKFSNPDLVTYQKCLRAEGGRFDCPWGIDEAILGALAMGARGGVGSTYNFAAPIYHKLLAAFRAGDWETARRQQFRSVQLVDELAARGFMASAKALMGFLGVDPGPPRLPHTALTPEAINTLRQELEAFGFFE